MNKLLHIKFKLHKLMFLTFWVWSLSVYSQSTHGDDFKVDCKKCHNPNGWKIDMKKFTFNHDSTNFPLQGQHTKTDCNSCHKSLKFKEVKNTCVSCHSDVHNMTVGNDCARCHDSKSWLIDNIPELHEQNGFPLTGSHTVLSCVDCHKSENTLEWKRIGNECVSCHKPDYDRTISPNHKTAGFSTNCTDCHEPISNNWGSANFHYFFPLTLGHNIKECSSCHKTSDFKGASTECISCHQETYNNAKSPDHKASGFSTNCLECHTTAPGWEATIFKQHDAQYFPINSGRHQGTWNACSECHTTPNNFKLFSCINCHEHSNAAKLADEHDGERNYKFESAACYKCHPRGDKE